MKRIITFLTIAFACINLANAQGNLQFNRVVNIEFRRTFPAYGTTYVDTNIVVPTGKIWKVESSQGIASQDSLFLNPGPVYSLSNNGNPNPTIDYLPIYATKPYLPTGTYKLGIWINSAQSYIYGYKIMVTAVEFNVVQ
jgi:hypothetical protein